MTIEATIKKLQRVIGATVIPATPRPASEGPKNGDFFSVPYKGYTISFSAFKLFNREAVSHAFATKRNGQLSDFHESVAQCIKHIDAVTRGEQVNYFE